MQRLVDNLKFVTGCSPAALTSTAGDGDYVSMREYARITFVLSVLNATTVTGGTITLKQATDVAGTSEKALSFTKMWANTDTGASDTLVETTVSSDTFTTSTTNSKPLLYIIEVSARELDIANGFDCIRLDSTGMAAAVGCCIYLLSGAREKPGIARSAITD